MKLVVNMARDAYQNPIVTVNNYIYANMADSCPNKITGQVTAALYINLINSVKS